MAVTSGLTIAFGVALLISLHSWINRRQPEPYMDELYHIPQAQEFCTKAIERRIPGYHPSITTLPGLYLPNAILAVVFASTRVCSTSWLRATSALAALLCLPILVGILRVLRTRYRDISSNYSDSSATSLSQDLNVEGQNLQIWLMALITWLHPVFLFYANLFYTDTLSMFWVLLTWYHALKGRTNTSAFCGVLSTLTRQTNMVWHAFIVLDSIVYEMVRRKRREGKRLVHSITMLPRIGMRNIGHGVAFVMYIAFLTWNGSVAVGDKLNHEVTLHYAMFPYFLGFHTASYLMFQSLVPDHITRDLGSLRRIESSVLFMSSCFILAALVTATGDKVHPFILADNRHFTFYIYRKWILRSSLQRLVLVPFYAWSLLSCHNDFSLRRGSIRVGRRMESQRLWDGSIPYAEWVLDLFLFLCTCVTLIPSGLLEPRYFTAANMLLTIRRISRTKWGERMTHMALMSAFCVLLNLVVAFVFAEMPFERPPDAHMPLDKSPGRFMF